jgi:hypothetical protein
MEREVIRHIFIVGTLALGVAIILAITSTVRSQNSSPTGLAISYGEISGAYAAPFDPYAQPPLQLATLTLAEGSYGGTFSANININQPNGWIYKNYYVLKNGYWQQRTFAGQDQSGWFYESKTDTWQEQDTFPRVPGDDYVVAFWTCKRYNNAWR